MAKFCTYCGKPLPESGVCDCEEAAARAAAAREAPPAADTAAPDTVPEPADAAAQTASASEPGEAEARTAEPAPETGAAAAKNTPITENVYVKKTKEAVNQSVPFLKEYWKEPMQATLRVMREKNMALSIVMMVVNALVTGLLLFTCFSRLAGEVRSASRGLSGLFGGSGRVDVSVPFFTHLLMGVLMAALALALSALALFALLKLLKINASFSYLVMAVGVNSVLCTACLVLALLCALFGWATAVLLFLLLAAAAWVILGVLLLVKVFGVRISGLMLTLSSALFAVVLALNCWLGGKLVLGAAGQIKVEDVKIKEAIEEIGDLDLEDLFGQMMGSAMYGF